MNIKEIARRHVKLIKIAGIVSMEAQTPLTGVVFHFNGLPMLTLSVDCDEDSLIWAKSHDGESRVVEFEKLFPSAVRGYGLLLAWAWEMRNHQGYFDALQLELTDLSLAKTVVIQFKVVASAIQVFDVSPLK